MRQSGKVHLVGAGPGDPELLTLRALRLLQEADVVVHDRLVAPEILRLIPACVRRISVGKAAGHHSVPQERINAALVDLARQGLEVVRLKGGDPLIFGRGAEEALALHEAGIAVDYVPGITAAQGAASTSGVPLTHRGLATGVRYVTGHRASDGPLDLDWSGLAAAGTTLVVYMGAATMAEIALELMRQGAPADLPVLAVASATTPRERRVVTDLSNAGAAAAGLGSPVLFIVGPVVSLCRDLPVAAFQQEARLAVHA